ncbi:unnamed protein product, partial [Mesorhabditis belari]|uniref:Uncharacterized protein n=1 Tax=Mesorhabditis belari TaxID=2138241 RepID=A0AAF3F2A2_9BILA
MLLSKAAFFAILISATIGVNGLNGRTTGILNWEKRTAFPFNDWHCGYSESIRNDTYALALREAPRAMELINECCIVHQHCYTKQHGRSTCDHRVCGCVTNVVEKHALPQAARYMWNMDECERRLENGSANAYKKAANVKIVSTEDHCDTECRHSYGIAVFLATIVAVTFLFVCFRGCTKPSKLERVKGRASLQNMRNNNGQQPPKFLVYPSRKQSGYQPLYSTA